MTRTTKKSSDGHQFRRSARINAGIKEDTDGSSSSAKRRKLSAASTATVSSSTMPPLLDLGKLIRGTVVKRPSSVIKSPYVADVSLLTKKNKASASTVLAHAPALDVGGMCVAGSEIYLSERDGGGKTSHSIELVRGAPLTTSKKDNGVLVGAHPRLGELIAEQVLKLGLLTEALPLKNGFELGPVNDLSSPKKESPKKPRAKKAKTDETISDIAKSAAKGSGNATKISLQQQVTLGDSRVDFQMNLSHGNGTSHRIIFEVKNVVCADYESGTEPTPNGPGHCVVVAPTDGSDDEGYQRSALFPWGRTRGQTFDGRKVVSERACKHLRNLRSLIDKDVTPVVLFIVNRSDCESVRACQEKCPVFAEVLKDVVKSGVKALAVRVRWTEEGQCYFDGVVPVKV